MRARSVAVETKAATSATPRSTDAVKPTAPPALRAGQSPKWEKTPPPGAASPIATTLRGRPPSTTNTAWAIGASLSAAVNATAPAPFRATRSENFAKIPPIGVSSPAPTSIRILPALATNTPPGTARPSTTAANATAPAALSAGTPKPAKAPPAGAGSP